MSTPPPKTGRPATAAEQVASPDASAANGVAMALFAYTLWGLSVLFYKALASVNALEIIGHRGFWSVVVVAIFLGVRGRLAEVRTGLADRRALGTLAVSATFLIVNWGVFVWATIEGQVLAVSFGYFINPIFSVLLGLIILGERLNRAQAAAIVLSLAAIALQAWAIGGVPWISVALAGTFALYGYLRKTVSVAATPGLLIENLLYLPISIALIWWFNAALFGQELVTVSAGAGEADANGGLVQGPWMIALLALTGPMTAVPLILFSAAARRLPLTLIGLMQYIVPSLHFAVAVFVFAEPLEPLRLATFVLIWFALAIMTADGLRTARQRPA